MSEIVNSKNPSRSEIERLQGIMRELPQAELPTEHYYADGVYLREMRCKADTLIVGKVHKREHFFILVQGEMTLTGDGLAPRLVKAPFMVVSPPGVKRVGIAHTDCIVMNIHRTDSRNLDEIELELIEPDETALFDARNHVISERLPCLGRQ